MDRPNIMLWLYTSDAIHYHMRLNQVVSHPDTDQSLMSTNGHILERPFIQFVTEDELNEMSITIV